MTFVPFTMPKLAGILVHEVGSETWCGVLEDVEVGEEEEDNGANWAELNAAMAEHAMLVEMAV